MTFFWLLLVAGAVSSLIESDAYKIRSWHERGHRHAVIDRVLSLPLFLLALWQLWLLWGAR